MMSKSKSKKKVRSPRLLGLAESDGHTRVTNGQGYTLVGGTKEGHERMQETAAKFNEELAKRSKPVESLTATEFRDMIEKASE